MRGTLVSSQFECLRCAFKFRAKLNRRCLQKRLKPMLTVFTWNRVLGLELRCADLRRLVTFMVFSTPVGICSPKKENENGNGELRESVQENMY